jgi:hypothetical protein
VSAGGWIAVAALVGLGVGIFLGWKMHAGDQSLTDTVRADAEAERGDRLVRLVRLLGATDRDLDDLDRGVLTADVADAIKRRVGS